MCKYCEIDKISHEAKRKFRKKSKNDSKYSN